MAIERLGKDYKHFYPWRTLSKANAILIGGSDFPIESHNPFLGIDAFVNRVGNGEIDTWDSHETLSIEDALKTYCSTPHQILCSIYHYDWLEVNAKADFLVIDNDLSDKSKIKNTKVIATICNGKITKYL
jgi:predicted amidohydrolase YtcJ